MHHDGNEARAAPWLFEVLLRLDLKDDAEWVWDKALETNREMSRNSCASRSASTRNPRGEGDDARHPVPRVREEKDDRLGSIPARLDARAHLLYV